MARATTATFAEFAALNGWRRSYVTQLKRDGRLVLTEDGKGVRVAESLARIRATEDPARTGVKARHAAKRATAAGRGAADGKDQVATSAQPAAPEAPAREPEESSREAADFGDEGFQYWRRRSEKAKALSAERENAVAEGRLMDAGEVAAAVSGATTTLRARLESLPDVLAPQLAATTDEGAVRGLLTDAIEHALEECARQFSNLARESAHG